MDKETKCFPVDMQQREESFKRRRCEASDLEIMRRALAPGGLLAAVPGKSLALAEAEFAERYWLEEGGRPDLARDARTRCIKFEQK